MTTKPITCFGNDLDAVLADIRLHGGCIEAMDVIGRAKYRVSYFERIGETEVRGTPPVGQTPNALNPFYRVAEESQSARVRDPDTGHAGPVSVPVFERESRPAQADDSFVLSTGALATSTIRQVPLNARRNVAAGDGKRAEKPKSVPDAPASIRPDVGLKSDHQVSESDDESGAVKCSDKHRGVGVSDRDGGLPLESPECGHATLKRDEQMLGEGDPTLQRRNAVPGFSKISIEDRMAALQSKLLAVGRIKRSKPKTMPDNYRSPYAD